MFPLTRSLSPLRNVAHSPQKVLLLKISYKTRHPKYYHRRLTSNYQVHPEKMQQLMREREAQSLCSILASEEYRKGLNELVETQTSRLKDGFPAGTKLKYQHVISCAQPIREFLEEVEEEELEPSHPPPPRKSIKPKETLSIVSVMMKKKKMRESCQGEESQSFNHMAANAPVKKIRKRTTILPIFLNKMQLNVKSPKNYWSFYEKVEEMKKNSSEVEEASTGESSNVEEGRNSTRNFTTFTLKNRDDTESTTSVSKKSKMKRRRRPISRKMEQVTRTCEMNFPADTYCQVDESIRDAVNTEHLQRRRMSTYKFYPIRNDFVQDTLTLYERVRKGTCNKELEVFDHEKYESAPSSTLENAKQKSSRTYMAVTVLNKKRQNAFKKSYSPFHVCM